MDRVHDHDGAGNGVVSTLEREEIRQKLPGFGGRVTGRFDKSEHFPESQQDVANALARGLVNAERVVDADTLARVHRGTRLARLRSNRMVGKAMAVGTRLERHVRAGRAPVAWGGPVDPMFATLAVYLLSCGLSGAGLEFGGSRASLQVWSDTLGGEVPTTLIAACLGLVLVLLGHLVGHMVFVVIEAKRTVQRLGALVLVAALVVPAVLAIDHIGRDRPKNLRAQSALAKAALLETAAEDGEREARNADRRAAGGRGAVKPSAAGSRLRAQAQADRLRARQMTTQALDDRSLGFFTAAQIAAFALAAGGGFFWAGGQMERLGIRYEKLKAKATGARTSLKTKFLGIAMLNLRSDALTRTVQIPQSQSLQREFDAMFTWLFGPEPDWPNLEAASAAVQRRDGLDQHRHRDAERPVEVAA